MNPNEVAGTALAGLLLSAQSLLAAVRNGHLRIDEARDIVARSRSTPSQIFAFPGDPAILAYADGVLANLDTQMLQQASPPPSSSVP